MQFAKSQNAHTHLTPVRTRRSRNTIGAAASIAVASLCLITPAAKADSLTRSAVVSGTPSQVWAIVGPFCAIKDWLPPVGSCTQSAESPLVRTLVTKDGKATFVERQVARSDRGHSYSYVFVSSPLPVSRYRSTIEVADAGRGHSRVSWHSTYTPNEGHEADAKDALGAIYDAGLSSIQAHVVDQIEARANHP